MKYLGIDYGTKRVGVAISDENGVMAFPKAVFKNDAKLLESLSRLCAEEGVGEIVIGESKNYKGEMNTIMEKMKPFLKELAEKVKVKINFHPEFMTSMEASRIQGENEMLDASAAVLILQNFIDASKS